MKFNAGGGSNTSTGTISGISCTAYKSVSTYTRSWSAAVRSTTNSNISIIGYTWWTAYQICTDDVYSYYYHSENLNNSNSNYYLNSRFVLIGEYPCNQNAYVDESGSLGNHEFTQGSTHEYPRVDYIFYGW